MNNYIIINIRYNFLLRISINFTYEIINNALD